MHALKGVIFLLLLSSDLHSRVPKNLHSSRIKAVVMTVYLPFSFVSFNIYVLGRLRSLSDERKLGKPGVEIQISKVLQTTCNFKEH